MAVRTRQKYTSKGERPNVSKKYKEKQSAKTYLEKMINKVEAHARNKKVVVTVPNEGGDQRKMPFVKVPGSIAWPREEKNKKKLEPIMSHDNTEIL